VAGPSGFSEIWGGLPSSGFGFGKFGDDAELLHEAEGVPIDVAFRQLAVRQAGNGDAGDVDLLPGWRNPVEFAFMSTATGPTGHDCVPFGNDVLDR
jgi:hypothetical protein